MSVHMITSYKGSAHITAADTAALTSGIAGTESYRLAPLNYADPTQNMPVDFDPDTYKPRDFTIIDNNHVQVPAGQWVWNGRHIIVDAPEQVTIESGQSGLRRIDLVCLHYTKNTNTSVENVELSVIKGTPSAIDEEEPKDYTSYLGYTNVQDNRYLVIARVHLEGLTLEIMDPNGSLPFLPTIRSLDVYRKNSVQDVTHLVTLNNPAFWNVTHLSAVLHNKRTVSITASLKRQTAELDNPAGWFTEKVFTLDGSIKCPTELHTQAVSNASDPNGIYAYANDTQLGLRKIDGNVRLGVGGWVEYSITYNLAK